MAISLTPLRTSCKSVLGETIFEDGEFEKQIRKKYSWWLPVALPCRLRDSSPLTDHSISGKLSSDVALWLVELRHASDSDDLLTGLKLRVECENTSTDKWNFVRGKCRDSVELETTDERDSDTISGDLYVLSEQQIVGPDLSSADVIVDDKGVVLDQVNHNSTEIIPLITPHIERTECDEDISYRSKELVSTVSAFHLGEEIDGIAGGGVHQSWTANPCYTAVTVGGVKWQCRGDCYREREARFRKLCQSVLEELGRTLSNELAAFCPQDSEVECLKCSVFESDKIPGSNISDKQAHYSLKAKDKSTAPSFASRSNSESTDSDISVVLLLKSELFMNELKTTDDGTSTVCVNEPSCRALFTASDNNRDLGSALHSLSEGSNQCNTANPVNNKCDDVLRDIENIMHCLQGMEDSYASRNSEIVECQENQDVEFLLLCNNADHLITETLQCYKSQWIPNRKEKSVSETNSNISDDVFLSPVSKSDETDVFLNDTPALEVKEHYNFNINDIFDDGTKPPIPPLRRKKREKSNLVADCSLGQAISLGLKTRHESETVNLHDCHRVCTSTPEKKPVVGVPDDGETLLADSQYNLLFTESTTEKDKSCSYDKYPDLCSAKRLINMSSTENIIVPNKCDLSSDSNVSITCGEPPATTILENDSYSHSSVLEVAVPQAIPVSSFEFPPCSAREGEVDEISNSVEICGKQRIRPVVSLQDFASNIYEDIYPSYSSLDRSRKGSGSSDIAAWKNELQRSGFFSQGDDCLQSDEWFSSTDHEGRVYFFEENSVESSWSLPKVTVDDSEVSVKKSVLDAPVDPLLRAKEGEKRSTTRMTKARSLLVTDKKQRESSNRSSSIPKNFLLDQSAVLKEGPLNRTKITENGKKVRKNWAVGHVVLREQFLVFYKDSKSVQPELVMELSEVVLESGDKMSKRKNVFLVSTAGLQVLCQAEDTHLACDWCSAIKQALESLDKNSKNSTKLLTPHSPGEENRCSSLVRSRSLRSKNHEGSTEDQLSNYEEQTKIRNRLKRFFHRRPTRETLARKGIYKDEPVFDNHLEKVCPLEHPRIPKFVQLCVNAIEGKEENMKTDGLYRASGNLSHVQKIRLEVDQNNLQVLEREDDVHVLTGALKLFFRELKEPLIPFELFTTALETVNSDKKKKIQMFQDIVQQLPDPNRDTLAFLLRHLRKVTEYEEHNRMHIPNLAIVFGPTLIWREKECHQNMALEYMQQNLVIEFFLLQYDEIFKNFKLPDS